ncbi:substrate binding domain-containing protein, partial [Pseudomonas sp. R2.Fl]|nr:substrate binding domain-containing protein [Pseudomonas sp. R2.Fl]
RRLCSVRWLLVASPFYLARHGRPEHPRELARHKCLIYTNRPTAEAWRFHHVDGEQHSVSGCSGSFKADNPDAITSLLLAGHGIALLPEFLVREDIAAGRVEEVFSDWHVDSVALNLLMPPGRLRPARVTALVDYLAECLAIAPWIRATPRTEAPFPMPRQKSASSSRGARSPQRLAMR